ncbi:DsbA family protein [Chitinimonas sp. BJB300]|uniref:DsbA family protein n=1 Tax=Chitinimonas sp. BJB300 TaxID=1559339 RepID=UPI001112772F|nr:DsbA family protein [Chitinimonas sp. BJB300]TSJ90105.1 DsbA family protein [Chitinimonas sp. BJB300]
MQPKLTLLFDPLCGWCYGAHSALAGIDAAFKPEWTLLPTGLFTKPQPMSAEAAAYYWQNDQRIAELTGQIFSTRYRDQILGDHTAAFDSTTATQAWIRLSAAQPKQSLAALARIQALRYRDGMPHDASTLAQIAAEFGLDAETFEKEMHTGWPDGAVAQMTQAQNLMQQYQLRGVPTLLFEDQVIPSQFLYQTQDLVAYIHSLTN